MKKGLYAGAAIILLLVVCIITRPNGEDHKNALIRMSEKILNEKHSAEGTKAEQLVDYGITVSNTVVGMFLDTKLQVRNCVIFSLGRVKYNDGPKIVSFGILGFVIPINKPQEVEDFVKL